MNNESTNITFYKFAWNTLTDQQQFRINVKYELVQSLKNRGERSKASVYRAIAYKYGYTFDRIKDIDIKESKK